MHPKTEDAFDEIDAAVFSGDTFLCPVHLATLKKYLGRWQRAVPEFERLIAEAQAEEENGHLDPDEVIED